MSYLYRQLILCLSLFLLGACRDNGAQQASTLRYQDMPKAFSDSASLPEYAKAWRCPKSFVDAHIAWNQEIFEWRKKHNKTQSLALGDYIQFRRVEDMPEDLVWEDGQEEEELGSDKALKGGTLRIALQRSFPNTIRSLGAGSNNSTRSYIYDNIEMPLVRQHPQSNQIIAGTAARWAVCPEGHTVYFQLDQEARYSNGDKLSTQDYLTALYLYNHKYCADPLYSGYYKNNIEQITIYSDELFSVRLQCARPFAPIFAAIPAHNTRFYTDFGPDFITRYQWRIPPTTGGYTLDPKGIVMGQQIRLSRVRDWWAAHRRFTKNSCNVDFINYTFITEMSKIRELFRIGELDYISTRESEDWYNNLEINEVHQGYIQRVHFCKLWPCNSFGFHLNSSKAPFDDINVRRGFHHALNIQNVIEQIFRGDFERGGSYFAGFGEFTNSDIQARDYAPEKARQYFAAAGYTEEGPDKILQKPDGTRLEITVSTRIDPLYSTVMSWLSTDAAACGLDLKTTSMDDTLFFTHVLQKKPQCSIFSWGFSPPLPNPENYFHSKLAYDAQGQPLANTNNITATAVAELDAAIEESQKAYHMQSSIDAHHKVQALIHDAATWVPGWTSNYWRFAQWRWLRWPVDFCPPRYYEPLDSQLYWIDPEWKEKIQRARKDNLSLGEKELYIPLPPLKKAI